VTLGYELSGHFQVEAGAAAPACHQSCPRFLRAGGGELARRRRVSPHVLVSPAPLLRASGPRRLSIRDLPTSSSPSFIDAFVAFLALCRVVTSVALHVGDLMCTAQLVCSFVQIFYDSRLNCLEHLDSSSSSRFQKGEE
jgi:hypothetical protein